MGEFRMKNKYDKSIFENVWITRLLSLFVAVLLFFYVYSENYGLTTTPGNNAISTTRRETISNLPIQVNMDTDRYFIAGLPETVVLSLSGPESVIVQTISADDFSIVTEDLDAMGPGQHTIQLIAENISDELNYTITPSRVNVTIEEKETIESPVEVRFDSGAVDDQYIAGEPILSHNTVTITGPTSTIDRIYRIYVRVPAEGVITTNVIASPVVQVEDRDGNKLNVKVDPQEIRVEIPVKAYEKKVPIKLEKTGTPAEGKKVEVELVGDGEVTIKGNRNLLADIEEAVAKVDVTGIKTNTVLNVPVTIGVPTAVLTPDQVQVNVTVTEVKSESKEDVKPQTKPEEEKDDQATKPDNGE